MRKRAFAVAGASIGAVLFLAGCGAGGTLPLVKPEPTKTWYSIDASEGGTISLADTYKQMGVGRVLVCISDKPVTISDTKDFTPMSGQPEEAVAQGDGSILVTPKDGSLISVGMRPPGVAQTEGQWVLLEMSSSNCSG